MGILSIVHNLRSRKLADKIGLKVFVPLVERSQLPAFQGKFAIPDTPIGSFAAITLHMFLILQRLKNLASQEDSLMARNVGQALYDTMWGDFDQCLREMGVGDLRVGKQIKELVQAFHGHVQTYESCGDNQALWAEAILRNIYIGHAEAFSSYANRLADYAIQTRKNLASHTVDHIYNGLIKWPSLD